jgi:hypothetical protein
MNREPSTTVERAFALARSGARSIDEIRNKLRRERYNQVEEHLAGASIRKQLQQSMTETRAAEIEVARAAAEVMMGKRSLAVS